MCVCARDLVCARDRACSHDHRHVMRVWTCGCTSACLLCVGLSSSSSPFTPPVSLSARL